MTIEFTDVGHGHSIAYTSWRPDRDLNPQYKDLRDVERYGLTIKHTNAGGFLCMGSVVFEGPVADEVSPDAPKWAVESWQPLSLSPSISCHCGDQGYLKNGYWIPA